MGVEPLIPFPVVLAGCFFIVLAAIQLDHQRRGGNIKIGNIATEHLLPIDGTGQFSEKIVPKMPLFGGHPLSQLLGKGCKLFVLRFVHC